MIAPRRIFLRQLACLPLIGGSVALIGQPSAAAEPVTEALLDTYLEWLNNETVAVAIERVHRGHDLYERAPLGTPAHRFHYPSGFYFDSDRTRRPVGAPPQPSSRAALVLSAVGCDWRGIGQ